MTASPPEDGRKYRPSGWSAVAPYFIADDVEAVLQFIVATFDTTLPVRNRLEDGTVTNATVTLDGSSLTISRATSVFGAMPLTLYVYVPDCDTAVIRALHAGATLLHPLENKPYGDRNACIQDPFGNRWWIATHVQDVPPAELSRRLTEYQQQLGSAPRPGAC